MSPSSDWWGSDRLEVDAPVRYGPLPSQRGVGAVVETRTRDAATAARTDLRYRVRWPDGWTYWYRRCFLVRVGPRPAAAKTVKRTGGQWPDDA